MFASEEDAQVSAEMLIVLAALIAVAIILVMQLQKASSKSSAAVNTKVEKALDELSGIGN